MAGQLNAKARLIMLFFRLAFTISHVLGVIPFDILRGKLSPSSLLDKYEPNVLLAEFALFGRLDMVRWFLDYIKRENDSDYLKHALDSTLSSMTPNHINERDYDVVSILIEEGADPCKFNSCASYWPQSSFFPVLIFNLVGSGKEFLSLDINSVDYSRLYSNEMVPVTATKFKLLESLNPFLLLCPYLNLHDFIDFMQKKRLLTTGTLKEEEDLPPIGKHGLELLATARILKNLANGEIVPIWDLYGLHNFGKYVILIVSLIKADHEMAINLLAVIKNQESADGDRTLVYIFDYLLENGYNDAAHYLFKNANLLHYLMRSKVAPLNIDDVLMNLVFRKKVATIKWYLFSLLSFCNIAEQDRIHGMEDDVINRRMRAGKYIALCYDLVTILRKRRFILASRLVKVHADGILLKLHLHSLCLDDVAETIEAISLCDPSITLNTEFNLTQFIGSFCDDNREASRGKKSKKCILF